MKEGEAKMNRRSRVIWRGKGIIQTHSGGVRKSRDIRMKEPKDVYSNQEKITKGRA